MRFKRSSVLCVLMLVSAVALAACGDNTNTPAPAAAVPTTAPAATTAAVATTAAPATTAAGGGAGATTAAAPAPTLADTKAEAGRQVFARTCGSCHLGEGKTAGRAPVLATSQNANNPDFVRNIVRKGGTRMPAVDETRLPNADLENIILYLKAIHT